MQDEKIEEEKQTISSKKTAIIIVISGEYEKLTMAFHLAVAVAAMDYKVTMFFVGLGIAGIRQKKIYKGKSFLNKLNTLMAPKNVDEANLTKMNLFGLGKIMKNILYKRRGLIPTSEMLEEAVKLNVEITYCTSTTQVFELFPEELVSGAIPKTLASHCLDMTKTDISWTF